MAWHHSAGRLPGARLVGETDHAHEGNQAERMGLGSSKPEFKDFDANTVEEAVKKLVPYLEDRRVRNHVIYFDGWDGLGASAVLNSIAEHPPPSLRNKFDDNIIHIDCSRWKSRRAMQRTIAQKLRLPQHVMAIFDRQDEEDDLVGVDEGSRTEISDIGREIYRVLQGQSSLVVFHNGSDTMVDFNDLGIPRAAADPWSNILRKVLWTFRGRLHAIRREKVLDHLKPDKKQPDGIETMDKTSYLCFGSLFSVTRSSSDVSYKLEILREEAAEIAQYTNKPIVTQEIAEICCRYLLSLNSEGNGNLDFNWTAHASNYWVCDGILKEFRPEQAWEIATCLHEELRLEGYSSARKFYHSGADTTSWIVTTKSSEDIVLTMHSEDIVPTVQPETTSFFLAVKIEHGRRLVLPLPVKMFQRSEQLHVLKLCHCSFSFASPPFLCCLNLRFLGLDSCMDHQSMKLKENKEEEEEEDDEDEDEEEEEQQQHKQEEEEEEEEEEDEKGEEQEQKQQQQEDGEEQKQQEEEGEQEEEEEEEQQQQTNRPIIEFFQSLWVLDICHTDWELDLSPNTIVKMATNIREINIKKGRIWHNSISWRCLGNIHKLRVIEPTSPWETSNKDEFMDMVKLELLDLSGNITIQFLPSLSGAVSLKTLILDGCTGLQQVLPETLPPSLETFSFGGSGREAKISRISLAGCARLVNVRLHGLLYLKELDLSNTSIKTLNLSDEVVQVPWLQRVILLGCEQLRAILWPKHGMPRLMVLGIDTRGGTEAANNAKTLHDNFFISKEREEGCRAFIGVTEMRFLQWLVLASANKLCWDTEGKYDLNICLSSSSSKDVGQHNYKEKMGPLQKSIIAPKTHLTYSDVNTDKASSVRKFQPLDRHVEIGEGISNSNMVTIREISAVILLMNRIYSLLVHDNSSIRTVIPESMMSIEVEDTKKNNKKNKKKRIYWSCLRWCCVERCPNLDSVFATNYDVVCFNALETFWAADLLMARCIWSKGRTTNVKDTESFAKLQAIHLHFCPKLTFVLPLSWFYTLSSLDTLHIVYCCNLSQVFPVEAEFLNQISTDHPRGVLEFPKLKHIYLQELPKLQQICEAKMFAPELRTITLRGCWSLKRLPATADRPNDRPVVDCEKNLWEKLEWDGKEAGHHPCLFETRHSKYYKKRLLRTAVLR